MVLLFLISLFFLNASISFDLILKSLFLIGLPKFKILFSGKNLSIFSYATKIFFAYLDSILFVIPGKEFCSCNKIGLLKK